MSEDVPKKKIGVFLCHCGKNIAGTVDVHKIAKDLKSRMACGGTAKKDSVELQGNHVNRVKEVLVKMGFSEDMIDVA